MNIVRVFRNTIGNFYSKIIIEYKQIKEKITFLEHNNLLVAIDFFEVGEYGECINRLKIMNKLWPNNERVKYLLGLTYILARECDKSLKVLNTIKKDYRNEEVDKLIKLAKHNKTKQLIDVYINSHFSIMEVENEIKKITI